MLYLLAIFLPPLAVLLCGKPFQAVINCVLCIITVWIGAVIHAILVVNGYQADKRNQRLIDELRRQGRG